MIQFNSFYYPSRTITLPGLGSYVISTTELQKALFVNNQPVSEMAEYISESVDYFVEDNEIDFSEKDLKKLIEQQIM